MSSSDEEGNGSVIADPEKIEITKVAQKVEEDPEEKELPLDDFKIYTDEELADPDIPDIITELPRHYEKGEHILDKLGIEIPYD